MYHRRNPMTGPELDALTRKLTKIIKWLIGLSIACFIGAAIIRELILNGGLGL
jgi:hypothetical protein